MKQGEKTATTRKGGYDRYLEQKSRQQQKTGSIRMSTGGTTRKGGYDRYLEQKATAQKLEQATQNPIFMTKNDPLWNDIASPSQKQAPTQTPVSMPLPTPSTNNIQATITKKSGPKKKKNLLDKAADAAGTAAGAVGNFLKGTAKGIGTGAAKTVGSIYKNMFQPKHMAEITGEVITADGRTLTGQAAVDYLNNTNDPMKSKDTIYKLENGKIVKTNGLNRTIDSMIDQMKVDNKSSKAEQLGQTVGDMIHQVGQMGTIGQGLGGLEFAENPLANKILHGGATGAINSLANSAINEETDLKKAAKDAIRGGIFFAAGTGASEKAGEGIANELMKRGLQNSIPAYIAEQGIRGAAFSAAGEAAQLPTYPALGDEMPSAKEIGTDIATGALYEMLGGIIRAKHIKGQSKKILEQAQEQVNKSGEIITALESKGQGDPNTMNTLYNAMQDSIARTRNELLSNRFLGQDAMVRDYLQRLDDISGDLWLRQQPYLKMQVANQFNHAANEGGLMMYPAITSTNGGMDQIPRNIETAISTPYNPQQAINQNGSRAATPGDIPNRTYSEFNRRVNTRPNNLPTIHASYEPIQNQSEQFPDNHWREEAPQINKIRKDTIIKQATQSSGEPRNENIPNNSTPEQESPIQSKIEQMTGGEAKPAVDTETKPTTDTRNEIIVSRLNRESNQFEPITFKRGEKVKVFLGKDTQTGESQYDVRTIKGIRHIKGESYMVDEHGLMTDKGHMYKLEPENTPQPTERTAQLKSETYDHAKANEVIKRMTQGKSSLEEVKKAYEYVATHEEAIKEDAKKMSVAELKKHVDSFSAGRMKKAELVAQYYEDKITDFIYFLNGGQSITVQYDFSGKGDNALTQYKKQAEQLIESMDEARFNELATARQQKIAEQLQKRAAYIKSIKEPETLSDFETAMKRRQLTVEEKRTYDRLKAQHERAKDNEAKQQKAAEREARAAEREARAAVPSTHHNEKNGLPSYTITEDKHDKTGEKLYVLKFDDRLDSDAFKKASSYIKQNGGYYSRYKKGYIFKEYPKFAEQEAGLTEVTEETKLTEVNQQNQVNQKAHEDSTEKRKQPITQAEKLRGMADKMQIEIDENRAEHLENTAKRQREGNARRAYADRLEQKQALVNAIANKSEAGELEYLDQMTTLTQLDTLLQISDWNFHEEVNRLSNELKHYPTETEKENINRKEIADHITMPLKHAFKEHFKVFVESVKDIPGCKKTANKLIKFFNNTQGNYTEIGPTEEELLNELVSKTKGNERVSRYDVVKDDLLKQRRLYNMGIHSDEALREAIREMETIREESKIEKTPEQIKQEELRALETEAANSKINGYFPTPKKIVANMLELADIGENDKVLEPEAGAGDIADEIGIGKVDVIEYNGLLREILQKKGHNVVGMNALEAEGQYDKIIMNPPFEKNQDIDHVTKLFDDNLKPGGRLVAITSAHFTFANDAKSKAFRELVNDNGYYEQLPEGSFKEGKRSTGVNTCLVVLDKETAKPQAAGAAETGTAEATTQPKADQVYFETDKGTYEKGIVTYKDGFGAFYEVQTEDGAVHEVTNVLTEAEYKAKELEQKSTSILNAQKEAIQAKEVMAQKAKEVVDFLKAQKDGKRPMKIYFSPELAGVDNIKSIGQYLKFTEDPKDFKLDTFQSELANNHPEIKDMGLEEFGTWLVDQVTQFRENKKLLADAELSYKETFKKLNISPKDMQSVKALEAAIKEVENNMSKFPLELQFFAEQQIKQYKSLLKQLKSEGVCKETIDRVAQLQREFKASQKALERERAKYEDRLERMIDRQKYKIETLEREKRTAVEKERFHAAIMQEKAQVKLTEEKAKRAVDRFKNATAKQNKDIEAKIKELKKIATERDFKMEPETKRAVLSILEGLNRNEISPKSREGVEKLEAALKRMKAYESTPGISDSLRERIDEIKTIDTNMSYEDFIDLYTTVKVLVNANKTENKLITATRKSDVRDAAAEFRRDAIHKHPKSGRGISIQGNGIVVKKAHIGDKIFLPQLMIRNLCAKLEGTKKGVLYHYLYENIMKGHTIKYRYLKKSMDFFKENLKNVDMQAIDKGTYRLIVDKGAGQLDGEPLIISSLEKIAIALNSFNEKNRYSLLNGGIVRNNTRTCHRIDEKELNKLVASLDQNERPIVDTILKYFSTLNQKQINELTMLMHNYEAATEEFYYPKETPWFAVSVKEAAETNIESGLGQMNAGNLENVGFLKPKHNTKTPINLTNPFEVVLRMMNSTAELSAYAAPLRDANLLLKHIESFVRSNYSDTMYKQLKDYVEAMVKPNNFQNENDRIFNTLYNNTVTAIFGLNVTTSLKQPLGMINAATEIEPRYLLKAMRKLPGSMKNKIPIIEEYAPYLWYRGQGNINREMSETNMKMSIDKTFYGKKTLRDYATVHITKTDMYVAYRIWEACEEKVKATTHLTPGSKDFYRKVGEMATEVTLTTQSSGEVTHRSQIMRSDNVYKKSITAFQGQLQIGWNQLDYAYEQFKETHNPVQFVRNVLFISLIPILGGMAIDELSKYIMGNDKSLIAEYQRVKQSGVGEDALREKLQEKFISEVCSSNIYTGVAYDAISSANDLYKSDSNNPLYRELQNLAKGVGYLKKQKYDQAFNSVSSAMLKLMGIPVDNVKKISKAGTAIMNQYDYSLTDSQLFSRYASEVNRVKHEYEKQGKELTKDQLEVIKPMNSYQSKIGRLKHLLEDKENPLTDDEKRQIEKTKQELEKTANEYFMEHMEQLY